MEDQQHAAVWSHMEETMQVHVRSLYANCLPFELWLLLLQGHIRPYGHSLSLRQLHRI